MKNVTLAILFLTFGVQPLFCQLEKGDISISFSSSFLRGKDTYYQASYSNNSQYISPLVGYMVSGKTMLGAGLTYSHFNGDHYNLGKYSSTNWAFTPFARYYFLGKNKFNPFIFAQSSFNHSKTEYEFINSVFPENWLISVAGGFGADYFLSPNIALQAFIGTSLFQNDYSAIYDDILFANIGVQTFINDREKMPGNLMGNYLCRGNFVLSGSGRLIMDDNSNYEYEVLGAKPTYYNFNLAPQLKYFTKNKTAVILGANVFSSGSGSSNQFNFGLLAGFERYMPINKRFYFVPKVSVGADRLRAKEYTTVFVPIVPFSGAFTLDTAQVKTVAYDLNGQVSFSLKYFTKGASIWSFGADYNKGAFIQAKDNYINHTQWWEFYAAYEYFFIKNLSVLFRTSHNRSGVLDNPRNFLLLGVQENSRVFNFSLQLNYFIFKNKCGANLD